MHCFGDCGENRRTDGGTMRNRIAMCSGILAIALGLALAAVAQAQAPPKHPITFDDLIKMHRVSGSQVARDGKWVAYAVSTPDIELNRGVSNIWIVPATGGEAIQVTQGGRDTSPAWSPDGKWLAFLSAREGTPQVYLLSMEGGEAKKLTQLSTGADIFKWAPDGKSIAFTSAVYVDCKDDACNAKRDGEKEKSKVKGRIYDHLLYRHWDHWSEGKHSHLFVMPADGSVPARDLTPEADYDIPPDERGAPSDINFSPDSKEICYTAVTDKVEAISTNADLFVVPVSGGEAKRITSNPGFDGNPVYSPDGRAITYHAQLTAGYEADRWRMMLYDRKQARARISRPGSTAAPTIWRGRRTAKPFTSPRKMRRCSRFMQWRREPARRQRSCLMATTAHFPSAAMRPVW